jgi:hypothetical protein
MIQEHEVGAHSSRGAASEMSQFDSGPSHCKSTTYDVLGRYNSYYIRTTWRGDGGPSPLCRSKSEVDVVHDLLQTPWGVRVSERGRTRTSKRPHNGCILGTVQDVHSRKLKNTLHSTEE